MPLRPIRRLKKLLLFPPSGTQAQSAAAENSPFIAARNEWDNRLTDLAVSRYNWMLFASALLLLYASLCGALVWQSARTKVVPYVVQVDRHGQAVAFGAAEVLAQPDERMQRYFLGSLVYNLRSVSSDPRAQRQSLARAYAALREPATSKVNEYFRRNNPFTPGRNTVAVQVTSVLEIEKGLWQIQWTETLVAQDGRTIRDEPWQAIVKVVVVPPTTSEALLLNPLGLFVQAIDWNQITPNDQP